MIPDEPDETEKYFTRENKLAGLIAKRWLYIESNFPKEVAEKCNGLDYLDLLVRAVTRRTKKGDLRKTCEVIGRLIEHIVEGFKAEGFGWHCTVFDVSKEFNTEENTFWIKKWEIVPSPKEKERLRNNIKKFLEKELSLSAEMINPVTEELLKTDITETIKNIEKSVSLIIKAKFLINIEFGSPP